MPTPNTTVTPPSSTTPRTSASIATSGTSPDRKYRHFVSRALEIGRVTRANFAGQPRFSDYGLTRWSSKQAPGKYFAMSVEWPDEAVKRELPDYAVLFRQDREPVAGDLVLVSPGYGHGALLTLADVLDDGTLCDAGTGAGIRGELLGVAAAERSGVA